MEEIVLVSTWTLGSKIGAEAKLVDEGEVAEDLIASGGVNQVALQTVIPGSTWPGSDAKTSAEKVRCSAG